MDFLVRIASLVRKELLAVLRDKKSRLALIIPPIIQIAIFGYAATMNVTRVPYAVLDKDGGEAASQYIADLEGTGIFQVHTFRPVIFHDKFDTAAVIHPGRITGTALFALYSFQQKFFRQFIIIQY